MISLKVLYKDTLFYTISKIVPGISGLASVVLFIRIVGAEEYGIYSFLLSQCYLISAIAFGWLNQAQLRYYNVDNSLLEYKSDQMRAFFYSSIISLFILYLLIVIQGLSLIIFFISFLSILGIGGFNYIKTFYQVKLVPLKIIKLTLIQSLMTLFFPLVLLFIFNKSANTILMGVSISFLIMVYIFLYKKNRLTKLFINLTQNRKKLLNKWFSFGSPLSIWFAVGLALPFLDRFFINHYLNNSDLGIYASVQEILTKLFSLTIFPLTMAFHPRIMNLWNESKKFEAIKIIKWGISTMIIGAFLMLILLWNFDSLFFNILNYMIPQFKIQNKNIILPLLTSGFLWQLSFLTHKMLELENKTKLMLFFILISFSINIIGNNYFIPRFGIIATSLTGFSSALVYFILTSIYSIQSIIKIKKFN